MHNSASMNTIASALNAVLAVPLDDLEKAMQYAHECDRRQLHDPPEVFTVSRQALRMLWRFRCHLDGVRVFVESE